MVKYIYEFCDRVDWMKVQSEGKAHMDHLHKEKVFCVQQASLILHFPHVWKQLPKNES